MSDDFNALDLLMELRGGMPEKCDFCGGPINDDPIPEEAGEWACRACYERWEAENAARRKGESK